MTSKIIFKMTLFYITHFKQNIYNDIEYLDKTLYDVIDELEQEIIKLNEIINKLSNENNNLKKELKNRKKWFNIF